MSEQIEQDDVRADYMGSYTLTSGKVLSIFDNGDSKLGIVFNRIEGYLEIATSDLPSFIQVLQELADEEAENVAMNADRERLAAWNAAAQGE